MSSFTDNLVVIKLGGMSWKVARSFRYYVGEEDSEDYIDVPKGFTTDFASVPRLFWIILPPDGVYTQAAVLHDYLYSKHLRTRQESDIIFREAMQILKVSFWKRRIMYRAVRMFGWMCWNR